MVANAADARNPRTNGKYQHISSAVQQLTSQRLRRFAGTAWMRSEIDKTKASLESPAGLFSCIRLAVLAVSPTFHLFLYLLISSLILLATTTDSVRLKISACLSLIVFRPMDTWSLIRLKLSACASVIDLTLGIRNVHSVLKLSA